VRDACASDADCGAGKVCARAAWSGANPARACFPIGTAAEGDHCAEVPFAAAQRCAPGLSCIFEQCVPACDGGTCGNGVACVDNGIARGCVAKCDADADCGADGVCVRFGGAGFCRSVGEVPPEANCTLPAHACAPGAGCGTWLDEAQAVFRCQACCNPLDPNACGHDEVCGRGAPGSACSSSCHRGCVRDADCFSSEACMFVDEAMTLLGCVPAL
jgi:hypothetical protein